jgi:hypothetical protein
MAKLLSFADAYKHREDTALITCAQSLDRLFDRVHRINIEEGLYADSGVAVLEPRSLRRRFGMAEATMYTTLGYFVGDPPINPFPPMTTE